MKIIISPAKKMVYDEYSLEHMDLPYFIEKAEVLKEYIKTLTYEQAKEIWKCNDAIAKLNFERFKEMDLHRQLTPALFAYEGIQYKHISPSVFTMEEFDYLQQHLVILSGFYGALRPFDGIVSYRLEMQAMLKSDAINSLYEYWGCDLAEYISNESETVLNLASKEYSKSVLPYLKSNKVIDCVFGELKEGKVIEKGTQVKMARGEAVSYLVKNQIIDMEDFKKFDRLGYGFDHSLSKDNLYVFTKQ